MSCPAVVSGEAFLSTLIEHLDCQGQTMGAAGYQMLAGSGSPLGPLLTIMITLFIALYGVRMMLGEPPSVREGVMAAAKVGLVLSLATSWPAYKTLVYDVVVRGPTELAGAIGGNASGSATSRDAFIARLQNLDAGIARLNTLGTGRDDLRSTSRSPSRVIESPPIEDHVGIGLGRVLFLSAVVAGFAFTSLGSGFLLALAPLFAGLMLFNLGYGLVIGWFRSLVFTLLVTTGAMLVMNVELALLEPWLRQTLQLRSASVIVPDAPIELLVMGLGFAIALAGVFVLMGWLSFFVHWPTIWRPPSEPEPQGEPTRLDRLSGAHRGREAGSARARAIATAMTAAQRRETILASGGVLRTGSASSGSGNAATRPPPTKGSVRRSARTGRSTLASSLRDRAT